MSTVSNNSSSSTPSTTSSSSLSLPSNPQLTVKLSPTNYLLWQAQLLPLLRCYHLIGHVDGTTPTPAAIVDSNPNPLYSEWYERDQLVLSWITLSFSEVVMPNILNKTTAFAAWESLAKIYASGSWIQIHHLRESLNRITRGNESAHQYLQRGKSLFDQLAVLGSPVSEDELVSSILHGLDESYWPFRRHMESRLAPIKFDDLHSLLLSEELQFQRHQTMASAVSPTTFYFQTDGFRGHGGRGRGRGGGGRFDPSRPSFYVNPSVSSSSRTESAGVLGSRPPGPSSIICHNCGGKGHKRPMCPSPIYSSSGYLSGPQTHLASSLAQPLHPNPQQWLLDSGTNHHLTLDLDNLAHHSEYNGTDQVTFENGSSHQH